MSETELQEGQFEVDGTIYELRFNFQKIKTIELSSGKAVSAELVKNDGVLSLQLMELLFSFGLVESKGLKVVPQKKAREMFESFIEANGGMTVNNLIVEKFQEDCGFLLR
ncbi:segregation and condensation protein B [Candidatus Enterococcus mansonii]|uniref:Segregation and condensation protein B n=1 Tax=Candidatus Enterococcus mansonii TaxID=1834181 RepID=A0A242CHI6_9ENTE|nr:segregation and condensation protein B [Enterococcus sp. 4G2_DIV0659]OTO09629.1 hypothetical protein A5880_000308 [Enterococcus sp. 4G2_DIV0659]